jgi:hypothetical protein
VADIATKLKAVKHMRNSIGQGKKGAFPAGEEGRHCVRDRL